MEENKVINEEVELVEENNQEKQQEEVKEPTKLGKAWNIIKKVFGAIGALIVAFLVVVVGWLTIDKYILKSPVPSFAGYSHLIVVTESMSGDGGIEAGDLIIIKDTKDYKIGDIVTFLHEGDTIPTTHRIINFDKDGNYITKGDNNNTEDVLPVTNDEIIGETVLVVENFGLFLDWIKNGGGLIYVIAFIVIIGAGIYVIKKVK